MSNRLKKIGISETDELEKTISDLIKDNDKLVEAQRDLSGKSSRKRQTIMEREKYYDDLMPIWEQRKRKAEDRRRLKKQIEEQRKLEDEERRKRKRLLRPVEIEKCN
jgi:hypothetical protein